jgi:hypothetical protein
MSLPDQETLTMTDDGHVVVLSLVGPRISIDWYGSQHAELTTEEARVLGYLLRGYARLTDTTDEPDR